MMERPMHTKELRCRFGMQLRENEPAPAEQTIPMVMRDFLCAIERAEWSLGVRVAAGDRVSDKSH
jgi:hypothetical protein